ncbi:MAG: hypothetical protein HC849_16685 [Oscillatoriales cyanobacterium RU_3_3]|nr:hypothetical protein [Oscillatoriales cyanobacterium RU_3_3]
MERQHLSQTKNSIAPPQPESAIARSSTHPIEELQGTIGNRAVNQLLANQPTLQAKPMFKGLSHELVIQPKLTIGEIGDKYEQEADRLASQVVEQINAPLQHSQHKGSRCSVRKIQLRNYRQNRVFLSYSDRLYQPRYS